MNVLLIALCSMWAGYGLAAIQALCKAWDEEEEEPEKLETEPEDTKNYVIDYILKTMEV